jgi:hypothetical protein
MDNAMEKRGIGGTRILDNPVCRIQVIVPKQGGRANEIARCLWYRRASEHGRKFLF